MKKFGLNNRYKKMKGKILMKNSEIRNKAKALGIEPGNMSKKELIHAIQKAENYTPCYGTSDGNCIYTDCCFREDCLKNSANLKGIYNGCKKVLQRVNIL